MRTAVWRAVAALGVAVASITFGPDPELRGAGEPSRPPSTSEPARVRPAVEAEAVVASIVTTTSTSPPAEVHVLPTSDAVWAHLARIRACESGGNYGAVSRSGSYRGAYQFSRATWDGTARSSRPELVGADPAAAAPADQDAMAYALYVRSGPGQWPHCGR